MNRLRTGNLRRKRLDRRSRYSFAFADLSAGKAYFVPCRPSGRLCEIDRMLVVRISVKWPERYRRLETA